MVYSHTFYIKSLYPCNTLIVARLITIINSHVFLSNMTIYYNGPRRGDKNLSAVFWQTKNGINKIQSNLVNR